MLCCWVCYPNLIGWLSALRQLDHKGLGNGAIGIKTFPAEKVTFHKIDLFDWKGLVKVTFNLPFLNLKCPISKTLKGLISHSAYTWHVM